MTDRFNHIKRAGWATAKLGAAGATIFAIGAIFLVANPSVEEPVEQAEADIFDFDLMAPHTKQEKFVQTLMDEGMEKPRSYDWNGNKFFFTMTQTKESPTEVMHRLQNAFVRDGVNTKAHHALPPAMNKATPPLELINADKQEQQRSMKIYLENKDWTDDFFGGGVVPTHVSKDYIMMHGSTTKARAEDSIDFLGEALKSMKKGYKLEDSISAMRFVDIQRNRNSGMTTVTATWSQDDLNWRKLRNERDPLALDVSTDTSIPSCIGCERVMRFAGEGPESSYISNVFTGAGSIKQATDFYDRAMANRGWAVSDTSIAMENLMRQGHVSRGDDATLRHYSKGKEFATILIYRDDETGDVTAQVLQSP